jgi:asparagine synthase (glutamine-hydrolysing)
MEEQLSALVEDSVRLQMISDVPLGSFLSGGVDSSLITALMAKNCKNKIKTFSIGFEKSTGVDESAYARKVSDFIGTEHHELILTDKDLARADQIFSTMNEPVADPTILPTAILSEFARKEVKVVLTGEGGDELFAGYNRYKSILYAAWVKKFPVLLQPLAAAIFRKSGRGESFQAIPDVGIHNWFELNRDFPEEMVQNLFQSSSCPSSQIRSGTGSLQGEGTVIQYKSPLLEKERERVRIGSSVNDPVNAVLALELCTSLVDRLLMKVDMASMGKSLEARPPYLDHRIVELAFRIPAHYKIRCFKGKYILRKTAEKFLPKDICWRRKHGFIVPITKWMNLNSREKLDSLLDDSFLEKAGIFDSNHIQKLKEKIYNNKKSDTIALLWPAIVLNKWYQSLKNGS